MNLTVLYSLNVLGLLRCCVTALPLISRVFKGLPSDSNRDAKHLVTNRIDEAQAADIIDLSSYGRLLYGRADFNYTGNLVANHKENETSVNPEELGSYLEGDILVPQKPVMLKNGLRSIAFRWPNAEIPFKISDYFEKHDLEVIALAMNEYHAKTCVRFKHHTNELDYISFLRGNSGCWSSIGRVGGEQLINLQAPGCFRKPGTVMHELMHVVGFGHEHNRIERDTYIDIQLQNVQRFAVFNFRKQTNTNAFGVQYDYGSVMHYSATAFSSNGQPTIVSKVSLFDRLFEIYRF